MNTPASSPSVQPPAPVPGGHSAPAAPVAATVPQAPLEPWVNTALACRHLGVSVSTLRRWVRAGRLSPRRTPTGEFRFRLSELDALLSA